MPPILSIEWRAYDTAELTVTYAEHVGPIFTSRDRSFVSCEACHMEPEWSTCDDLTRNLAAVVALAAAEQAARRKAIEQTLASGMEATARLVRNVPPSPYQDCPHCGHVIEHCNGCPTRAA